jgi:hypothetical protein
MTEDSCWQSHSEQSIPIHDAGLEMPRKNRQRDFFRGESPLAPNAWRRVERPSLLEKKYLSANG